MKIGNFRRIYKTDYPVENQNLVDKLSVTINNGFELIYNAFAKNISLKDNIYCTIKDITVKVNANSTPNGTLSFNVDTQGRILGISVIKAVSLDDTTSVPTSHPFIVYDQNNNTINISKIIGLPANVNFQLSLIAWGN